MLFPQKINVIANTRHLNPQGEVVVTQNDTGVEFLVSVVGDGGQTKLPQDTAYVLTSLHLRKQPSQKIGTLQADGNISFKLGAHELDQTGSVQAYVQAYHPLNGRVTSNPFIYHVASDPLSGAAIMPADKSLIETVIGDGPGIIQLAKEETQANITERARLTGAVGGALGSLEQDKTEALSTLEAAKAAAVEVTEVAAEKAGLAEEKAVFADAQGTFAKTEGEKAIAAAKLATDEAEAARLQKEEIAQTIAKGPVVSINGKTGPVTGIAEQAEVDEVNRKLADTTAQLADTAKKADLEVERQRINTITSLPQGATTNDARLEDIKVGADGATYVSPGEAVRKQFAKKADAFALTNLIKNGNFAITDLAGWTAYGGTLAVENGELVKTLNLLADSTYIGFGFQRNAGNKYYVSFSIKPKYSNSLRLFMRNTLQTMAVTLTPNIYNHVSDIIIPTESGNSPTDFRIRHSTNDAGTYQVGDKIYYDNIMVIDLTATFGAGKEPTKEQMDEMVAGGWFSSKNLSLVQLINLQLASQSGLDGFLTTENQTWSVV